MFKFSKSLAALASTIVVSILLLTNATGNFAVQDQKKTGLEGVWKVAEVQVPGSSPTDKGTTITTPQPGLLIFTKGYYSGMAVTGPQPRATVDDPKDPQNLTDAEKIARYDQWRPFIANAGKYEVKGSTLTMHAMVAKNPNAMSGTTAVTWEFKMDGTNALWLVPPPERATDARIKFMRVE